MFERIPYCSMHLRHTAQAVGILHTRIVLAMRLANLRAGQQLDQMRGGLNLPSVGPDLLYAGIEGVRRSHQRLKRDGSSEIGQLSQPPRAGHRQCADGGHGLRAIEQRQTFFGGQHDGASPARRKASPPGSFSPL